MVSMRLLHARGGYLYEHRRDIVPYDHLTEEELALWGAFLEIKNAERAKRG